MTSVVTVEIDCSALRHNLQRVYEAAPGAKVVAVIKANAYGHGLIRVAKVLQQAGVQAFAVARLNEALQLREAGIQQPIISLEGFLNSAELNELARHDVQVVVHHISHVELLEQQQLHKPVSVWLKIDSGMHRLGVPAQRVTELWQRLTQCGSVKELRLMTHLASADVRNSEQTQQQLKLFSEITNGMMAEVSIANSAGILGWTQSHGQWVRPGLMLYGASPFINGRGEHEGLRPVMTFTSHLIAVNQFKKGDAIGYGASWYCPEDMAVGVVACGYGDGYPRHAKAGTPVLLNDRRLPLVGRVSMDTLCVDLRTAPMAKIGDAVTLWGKGLPVEEVAECAATIPYELLCAVAGRVVVEVIN